MLLVPLSREHGFGLHAWVVWSEPLVLLHLLLHVEHLRLELGAQRWQSVSNMVGQRLETGGGVILPVMLDSFGENYYIAIIHSILNV